MNEREQIINFLLQAVDEKQRTNLQKRIAELESPKVAEISKRTAEPPAPA
jgi:hypothetical protein